MSLKYIKNNGTLLLFWTIINVNIPIVKQILSLLNHSLTNFINITETLIIQC